MLIFGLLFLAADWGPAVSGLRIGLSVESPAIAVVTFENVSPERALLLPLGRALQSGRAEFLEFELISPRGVRQAVQFNAGGGVAAGKLTPFVVPLLAGSLYSIRVPIQYLRIGGEKRVEPELIRGAALQVRLAVPAMADQWSGTAVSNSAKLPSNPTLALR